MSQTRGAQGDAIQVRQGVELRAGEASVRLEANGFRWTDQARLSQEGQDDAQDRAPVGMQEV